MSGGVGMQQWKPYPAYKDSGVEWLGQVPEEWEVKRLRFLCRINPTRSEISLPPEILVSFAPMESVGEYGGMRCQEKALDEISSGYTYFIDYDVLIAKITPCFENGKGALAENLSSGVGFGSTEFHVARCQSGLCPRFFFYFSISYLFRKVGEAYMYGAGGQKRIPDGYVRNFFLPTPSSQEQQAIASFLDHECARIDALIEKKRRLLELLEEKRRAVITQAVTRGLDPSVSMKDSGVEWLGQMPERWEVKRLRFLSRINPTRAEMSLPPETLVSFAPMEAVGEYGGMQCQEKTLDEIGSSYTYFVDYDVLIAKITPCFENGKGALAENLSNGVGFGSTEFHVVRCQFGLSPRFFFYFSISQLFRKIGEAYMYGAGGQKRIPDGYVKNFFLPTPSFQEQQAISEHLDAETAAIDAQRQAHEKSIALLREYRASLITHAVTGKIDVREHAPQQ
jgi:restriction endonuclease S subunit